MAAAGLRKKAKPQTRPRTMPLAALAMLASVLATEVILSLQGRFAEAIPLHLCSIASGVALLVALGARGTALDFLWYLGMPGAALALLFPAPAISRWQALFDASYVATHALILLIPALAMLRGDWPRRGRALRMMLLLQIVALAAHTVNRALGTDFLFLEAPPLGTPLEGVFSWGRAAYLLALEGIMFALTGLMQALREHVGPRENDAIQSFYLYKPGKMRYNNL